MYKKEKINNAKEKSITFEDLLKLFKDNKGKDIMLNKTDVDVTVNTRKGVIVKYAPKLSA